MGPAELHTGRAGLTASPLLPAMTADERRTAGRHRLRGAAVRVSIAGPEPARGRVRDISATGGLFVETRAPLAPKTPVRATLAASATAEMIFLGTVMRAEEGGMAVMLELDDAGAPFLARFVDAARETATGLELRIEEARDASSDVALSRLWVELTAAPTDAAANQRFIDACLAAKRLDFALDRLRALKAAGPISPQMERSLQQVGSILGFLALSRAPVVAEPKVRMRPLVLALAIAAVGIIGMGAAGRVTAREIEARSQHSAESSEAWRASSWDAQAGR